MKLPTQKYNPKQVNLSHSVKNTTKTKTPPRNTPKDDSSKDSAFTDEDDDLFSAIKMEEVKEELPDGDDDIFQAIETFENNVEQAVKHESR